MMKIKLCIFNQLRENNPKNSETRLLEMVLVGSGKKIMIFMVSINFQQKSNFSFKELQITSNTCIEQFFN